jgi:hypothetical protein
MKAFPLALIVASISIICILNIGLVSALDQGEISVSPTWSKTTAVQGDSATVTLKLTSASSEQIRIYRVGFHFDWMPTDSFYTLDLSDDPVVVPSSGLNIFEPMLIQIPTNVSAGSHTYFVGVDGLDGSYESFSWNSPDFTLQILDYSSKIYDLLLDEVNENISRAVNAGYQSADAQSLLAQAQGERTAAIGLADEGNWAEATSTLQQAYNHLEQAEEAEQLYIQQGGPQTLLLIVAVIVVIVVIVVIALMVRKRRKQPAEVDQHVDQPVDEQMETQDYAPEE